MIEGERMRLTVPGDPVPWARSRHRGSQHYEAAAQKAYRRLVGQAWMYAGRPGVGTERGALSVDLHVTLPRPASHYLRSDPRTLSAAGWREPVPLTKPDVDNLAKIILDELTRLGAMPDDACVIDLYVRKRYESQPGEAEATVMVTRIAMRGAPPKV